jgi:hypothetical protein
MLNEFSNSFAKDGTKMNSKEEATIHNFLINNYPTNRILYNGSHSSKNIKFYNDEFEEHYFVDWILYDTIIVEYFGYLNSSNNQHRRFLNYKEKTKRKIDFFSNLDGYQFVALFPKDLHYKMKNINEKINIAIAEKWELDNISQLIG